MKKIAALFLSVLLMTSAAAQDDDLSQPKVSFSAWRTMSDGAGLAIEGPYSYAPGKHRSEMRVEGQTMTGILREDLRVLWSLLPDQQLYMEFPLDSGNAHSRGVGFEGAQTVEHRSLGTEQVGGHRTTKYEVTLRQATGETASGTLWATADMIPVKMDMVLPGGERMLIEFKDIEIGPQPDFLFEIPAGYNRISLGALGELAGALESLPGRPRSSAARTDGAEDDPGFGQEVAEEALEGVREGTKRGVRQGVQENVTRRIRGIFRDR